MKKLIVLMLLISFLLLSSYTYADTQLRKLGRGIANMLTCPLELPKGVSDANRDSGPISALTFGIIQGVVKTAVRAVIGAYETATFLFPVPRDYEPILTDPEFFFEEGLF